MAVAQDISSVEPVLIIPKRTHIEVVPPHPLSEYEWVEETESAHIVYEDGMQYLAHRPVKAQDLSYEDRRDEYFANLLMFRRAEGVWPDIPKRDKDNHK